MRKIHYDPVTGRITEQELPDNPLVDQPISEPSLEDQLKAMQEALLAIMDGGI